VLDEHVAEESILGFPDAAVVEHSRGALAVGVARASRWGLDLMRSRNATRSNSSDGTEMARSRSPS